MRVSPGADPVATAAALTREGRGRLSVERPIESLEREAADMRPVVYGTVALLIVIAALNLLTTLGLGDPRARARLRRARLGRRDAAPGALGR